MKGYSYVAPSVLFTDNAIMRDIENNNATIETTKNSPDFGLRIAAQFKVRDIYVVYLCDNNYVNCFCYSLLPLLCRYGLF